MPTDCPRCCRALQDIERLVIQIEEITSTFLPGGDQREAVTKLAGRIVSLSRDAREAECREA